MQPHVAKEGACVVCDDVITNPVCPQCVEKSMRQWLYGVRPSLIPEIKRRMKAANSFKPYGVTNCVLCGNKMTVCPHCATSEIIDLIREEKDLNLEEEFLTFFDWDLVEREYYL